MNDMGTQVTSGTYQVLEHSSAKVQIFAHSVQAKTIHLSNSTFSANAGLRGSQIALAHSDVDHNCRLHHLY